MNFLTLLFQNGLSYSSICVARLALSCYLETDNCEQFEKQRLVKRFMKGVFELRPAFPKYAVTCDVDQRYQTLHSLTLPSMTLPSDKCVFVLDVLLKQSKRGKNLAPVELLAYSDERLCVVAAISELFISYQKP